MKNGRTEALFDARKYCRNLMSAQGEGKTLTEIRQRPGIVFLLYISYSLLEFQCASVV